MNHIISEQDRQHIRDVQSRGSVADSQDAREFYANAPVDYQLTPGQARTLRIALVQSLQTYGVTMIGETACRQGGERYAETSLIDSMVREHVRLNRYILGGKHYNNAVSYQKT